MKKLVALILAGTLSLSNCVVVYAIEKEVSYEVSLESQEIEENEIQKIFLHIDDQELLNRINYENSYLIISSGDNQKKIQNLITNNNSCYFQFLVDSSFESEKEWTIKEIYLGNDELSVDFNLEESFSIKINENAVRSFGIKSVENNDSNVVAVQELTRISSVPGNGSYSVTGTVDKSIQKVLIATWTSKNGQDDLVWEEVKIIDGKINHTINMRDHNNETGTYFSHVYAYDINDNAAGQALSIEMQDALPTLSDMNVVQGDGNYTITASISGNVTEVLFPTWTDKDGQDDILWHTGAISGNTVKCVISMDEHNNELGTYITHAYAYSANGKTMTYPISQNMTKIDPVVSDLTVINGDGYYTITGKINSKTTKVLFPTWTSKSGQDDIIWGEGNIQGDKVVYTVYMKDHKNEGGEYNTHVYAYDSNDNYTASALKTNVEKVLPEVKNVKIIGGDGEYTITADISGNVSKVLFPTWTIENGQDDIIWGEGTITGNKVSHTIYSRDHKFGIGEYVTHIYAYDTSDNHTVNVTKYSMPKPNLDIKNVKTTEGNGRYTITAEVGGGVTKVLFPTWSDKNGQDDLIWYEGKIEGNKATLTVDMKNHNYEAGIYNTHIYAYDNLGNFLVKTTSTMMINESPIIKNVKVSDVTAQGYLITCTVTDDYRVDKVLFPTWTTSNGQDDIVWEEGIIKGNEVSYRVYVKDHKYAFGEYNTHIYAYDAAGKLTAQAIDPISINESNMSSGWKIVNGHKYLYDAAGKLVNGSNMFVIDISEHNGDIDWQAVKNSGVDGVILRSSYGYNFGNGFIDSQMDAKFKRNVSELNRLGIPYGIYHFSYARNIGDGTEEARYMLECLKAAGAHPTLPLYYDLEYSNYVGDKNGSFYATIMDEFANVIQKNGYKVGVYANYNWFSTKLTDSSFNKYVKWVAHYGATSNNASGTANPNWHPSNEYGMWQYSSQGHVNGVSGNVDLNALLNW